MWYGFSFSSLLEIIYSFALREMHGFKGSPLRFYVAFLSLIDSFVDYLVG
jgi:hypothetical protein